jgi:hypothetical protein
MAKSTKLGKALGTGSQRGRAKRPTLQNPQAEKEARRGNVSMTDLMNVKSKADTILRQAGITGSAE